MAALAHAGRHRGRHRPDTLTVVRAAGRAGRGAAHDAGAVPFSEVAAHRATLEQAYMELTRDAVEFRAGELQAAELPVGDPALSRESTR